MKERFVSNWRLRAVFAFLFILCGLWILASSRWFPSVNLPLTPYRLPALALVGIGAVVTFLGVLAFLVPARFSLAAVVLVYLCTLGIGIGYRPIRAGDRDVSLSAALPRVSPNPTPAVEKLWVSEHEWMTPFMTTHPVLGFAGMPNVVGQHYHKSYGHVVRYTLDAEGWRSIPPPKSCPVGEVWFLGCSTTFGYGVDDEDTYVALLARKAWTNYRVRNFSIPAYGTNHATRLLEWKLTTDPKPAVVFYAMIGHHIQRNHLRQSFHRSKPYSFPFYEVENGRLRDRGLVPPSRATLPDSGSTLQLEGEVTAHLLNRMWERCHQARVPMVVLKLDDQYSDVLERAAIPIRPPILQMGALGIEVFPEDGHPRPSWHLAAASFLSRSRVLIDWTKRPDLYQPTAIARPPARWWVQAVLVAGVTKPGIEFHPDTNPVRFQNIQREAAASATFGIRRIPVRAKTPLEVSFAARADRPRDIEMALLSTSAGRSEPIGMGAHLHLEPSWQRFWFQFEAKRDDDWSFLQFLLKQSQIPFEIRDLEMRVGEESVPVERGGL